MTPAHATAYGKRSSAQQRRRYLITGAASLLGLSLFGCTSPTLVVKPEQSYWSGRLALQIEEESAQSFSALFELEGSEDQGELILLSPLGNTLGKLKWSSEGATLQTGQQQQTSHSLDALLAQVTGEAIPIKAIFDWLRGIETNAAGWVADLSALSQGRITAQRSDPKPKAILRIAFSH